MTSWPSSIAGGGDSRRARVPVGPRAAVGQGRQDRLVDDQRPRRDLADKPAFKGVFKKYRCLIPMDGFYEWQAAQPRRPVGPKGKPIKQPMFIHRVDDEPLAVAGLWSVVADQGLAARRSPWLHTCTIITTSANDTMAPVHDRMPVILPASAVAAVARSDRDDIDALQALLVPAPDDLLTMHKVSTEVNNVRNKGEELIAPPNDRRSMPSRRLRRRCRTTRGSLWPDLRSCSTSPRSE